MLKVAVNDYNKQCHKDRTPTALLLSQLKIIPNNCMRLNVLNTRTITNTYTDSLS